MLQEGSELLQNQLEALKLLKDWSTWLVTVQATALGLLAALWGKDSIKLGDAWARSVFILFGLSIVAATFVLGGVPDMAQRIPIKPHETASSFNIYRERLFSNFPDWGWLSSLWAFAFLEHILFLAGIGVFIVGVLRSRRPA